VDVRTALPRQEDWGISCHFVVSGAVSRLIGSGFGVGLELQSHSFSGVKEAVSGAGSLREDGVRL
jgi:hypothetical protein